jgi:hypothetical protein
MGPVDGNTGQRNWQTGPQYDQGQVPPEQPPGYPSGGMVPPAPGGGGLPPVALVGLGAIGVLVVAIVFVLVTDSGGSDDGGELQTANTVDDGQDQTPDTVAPDEPGEPDEGPEATEDVASDDSDDDGRWGLLNPADLPAPEIPESADPPELRPEHDGMQHPYNPFDDEYWPIIGEVYADSVPGDYIDVPVHLEAGQLTVMFSANDEIYSTIEVYDPNGEVIATAEELGEPGIVEGYEFSDYSDDALTETGVYVFRVIQHRGAEGGFPLRFFTPDGPDGE